MTPARNVQTYGNGGFSFESQRGVGTNATLPPSRF